MEVTKKKEQEAQGQEGKKPEIDSAIIEQLMKDYQRPEDLTGPGGIMEQLTKRLYERVLGAEMTHYLGYEKGQRPKPMSRARTTATGRAKKRSLAKRAS
jgi:putative transposase